MNWMDETITESHRERFARQMQELMDKYPELCEEAQSKNSLLVGK